VSFREDGATKLIIKTLAELQQPDERSLFWIVGGKMQPEMAAAYQQKVIARYDLSAVVPEGLRMGFERLRELYVQGILCYDLYTVAGDMARLLAEQALRERFLSFYDGAVTLIRVGDGRELVLPTDRWEDLRAAIPNPGKWRLQLRSGGDPIPFNGMLASLLRWARAEGLLAGQQDRLRDQPRAWFRNYVAHSGGYHLQGPDHAQWAIADLAHLINRLWGAPSGSMVQREVVAIAWDQREVTWGTPDRFAGFPRSGHAVMLVLANPEDPEFASYDALFETTLRPCDWVWGPGTWQDAQAWLDQHPVAGDQVETIDRPFLLQYADGLLWVPRAPAIAAALTEARAEGTWFLVRADSPSAALSHQRQVLAGVGDHEAVRECKACPVLTIGSGSLAQMLSRAAALGADVRPRTVPDVRVAMSRMPRNNRILGGGAWDIPPE
jgi:hypothetical protein